MGMAGLKVAGALCLLLGVIFVGLYLLKRFGPSTGLKMASNTQLKVLGHVTLGPKKKLLMVRFLNKVLLLGVTETSINVLSEAEADHASDFDSHINEAMGSPSGDHRHHPDRDPHPSGAPGR
jgi:flagellar protein FliO/FliZ